MVADRETDSVSLRSRFGQLPPRRHRRREVRAAVPADAVALQTDRAGVAVLSQLAEDGPDVERAFVERLDQTAPLRPRQARVGAVDRYGEEHGLGRVEQ